VWHQWLHFCGIDLHEPTLMLKCEILDYNHFKKARSLGAVVLPLEELPDREEKVLTMQCPDSKFAVCSPRDATLDNQDSQALEEEPCRVVLRCVRHWETEKRVFLIRHGESKWNKAMRQKNVVKLAAFDYPLTKRGIGESKDLNRRWHAAIKEPPKRPSDTMSCPSFSSLKEDFQAFLDAEAVFSSPLTRAVETCLIALQGHPVLEKTPVKLLKCAREVRGLCGLDTVGTSWGDDIKVHVLEQLASAMGHDEANTLVGEVDPYSCRGEWWTTVSDTPEDVDLRVAELVHTLMAAPGCSCILTGHSILFKEFYKQCASGKLLEEKPQFLRRLTRKKMANGACVMINLTCNLDSGLIEIEDAKLMFDSKLEDGLGEDSFNHEDEEHLLTLDEDLQDEPLES